MKILHSIESWLHPTENWIYDQIRSVDQTQDVLCSNYISPNIKLANGRVYTRKHGITDFIKSKISNAIDVNLKRNDNFNIYDDYDILFSHFGNRAWEDLRYTQDSSFKRIVRFYGIDLDYIYRKRFWPDRYKEVFRKYDVVIAEGKTMGNKLESFGCPAHKIRIMHLGIIPAPSLMEKTFAGNATNLNCLICGRFAEKKGFRYAVKAAGEFKRRTGHDIQLTIIGDASRGNDFAEKNEILSLVSHYNLNANFLGMVPIEMMIDQMKKNTVFLSPSVTPDDGDVEGGLPTTLIHAANQGMILLGTVHCDIPEIIHHGKNGYLAGERDVEGLTENLISVAHKSKDELRKMSAYGFELVRNEFNLNKQGEQLRSVYEDLISA